MALDLSDLGHQFRCADPGYVMVGHNKCCPPDLPVALDDKVCCPTGFTYYKEYHDKIKCYDRDPDSHSGFGFSWTVIVVAIVILKCIGWGCYCARHKAKKEDRVHLYPRQGDSHFIIVPDATPATTGTSNQATAPPALSDPAPTYEAAVGGSIGGKTQARPPTYEEAVKV